MPVDTAAGFVGAIQQAKLLEANQLRELTELQTRVPDPRSLAKELLRRGWLTPFQANQLFQGNGARLVLGPYLLLERLGEGGMGEVFKARHRIMDRIVALKVIRKDRLNNATAVSRFLREVKAAARLNHPNVVHASHADQVDGTYVLAMEFVDGTDLSKLVKKNGPLPVATACEYVRQAALGLQHAHEQGLIHRDIKPSNMLVKQAHGSQSVGLVKILDLGLAHIKDLGTDEGSSTLTEQGAVLGTPDFIAPEQAKHAKNVDIRADLYSLGCTLYYLLTGTVPHPGTALGEKLLKHIMDEPVPVEQLRPDVPAEVAGVVRKLMAKNPADRYQSPQELADVLETGLKTGVWPDETPIHVIPASALVPLTPVLEDTVLALTQVPAAPVAKSMDRRRLFLALGGGAAAFLVGLISLAFYLFRSRDTAPDLSKAKKLWDDEFRDRGTGLPNEKKDSEWEAGHLPAGGYSLRLWPGRRFDINLTRKLETDFACQLTGRVKGRSDGQWGMYVLDTNRKHGFAIVLSPTGEYQVLAAAQAEIRTGGPQVGPAKHPAVKTGETSNKLLIVVRGRRVEAYANSARIFGPVMLEWDILPASVGISAITRKDELVAELQRYTVWSGDGLR